MLHCRVCCVTRGRTVRSRPRRLFFALWPDDEVRHALLHWQTRNLPPSVRWQHRADLHLTLHFLGAVEADRVDALIGMGERIAAAAFGLVLDEIGYWPRPRVLWCAPSSIPAELIAFHGAIGRTLAAAGLTTDSRPYRPHVTLARRVGEPLAHGPLKPLSWTVRQWALVESVPGAVPAYRQLRLWSLAD